MALKNLRSAAGRTLRGSVEFHRHLALTQRADKSFAPLGARHASRASILPSLGRVAFSDRPYDQTCDNIRHSAREGQSRHHGFGSDDRGTKSLLPSILAGVSARDGSLIECDRSARFVVVLRVS